MINKTLMSLMCQSSFIIIILQNAQETFKFTYFFFFPMYSILFPNTIDIVLFSLLTKSLTIMINSPFLHTNRSNLHLHMMVAVYDE